MLKRIVLAATLGLTLVLLVAPLGVQAQEGTETVCRRLWGTEEWTRRCAPQRPDETREAYCRRIFGTDEWTRRCLTLQEDDDINLRAYCHRAYGTEYWTARCRALLANDFDPAAYCRRIYGTDEWTRRCLQTQTDPVRTPHRPVQERLEQQAAEAVTQGRTRGR